MRVGIVLYKFGSEKDFGTHLGSFHYLVKKIKLLSQSEHTIVVVAPWVTFWQRGSTEMGKITIVRYWPPLFNNLKFLPLHWLLRLIYLKQTQRVVLAAQKKYQLDAIYVRQAREAGYAVAKIKHQLGVPFVFRQITAWHWHLSRSPQEAFGRSFLYRGLQAVGLADPLLSWLNGYKAKRRQARTIYQTADQLVFSTNGAAAAEVPLGLDLQKVVTLPEAVETDLYQPVANKGAVRQQLNLPTGKLVLYVGRIHVAEKGIDYLVRAVAAAHQDISDIGLIIVGGGRSEEVEALESIISELKADQYITILGKRPFSDIPRYIQAADVVAVPSVWDEAFGRITVEAMSCGVPVVTTDTAGSPEVNLDRKTGLVVPAKNVPQLSQALVNLVSDSALAQRLGQAGRQRVLANYTYEKVREQFFSIIESVIHNSHGS